MRKFLQQLSRCPAYRPTITNYQIQLLEHISEFGIDNNLSQLMFDFKEVYDQLVIAKVPKVPFHLDPDESSLTNQPNSLETDFENIIEEFDNSDPTIAKFVKKPK